MIRKYSTLLKDTSSDMPCASFYIKDVEYIKRLKNCKSKPTKICKKVKLEPMSENLNTQFCIDSRECFKCAESNCINDYNPNDGYFNDILLLIFIFIIFQSICFREPCGQFNGYYLYQ